MGLNIFRYLQILQLNSSQFIAYKKIFIDDKKVINDVPYKMRVEQTLR